jgi:hypothetical protein
MVPDGKGTWVSAGPLGFYSAILKREFILPKGSMNNLSSIPQLFQGFVPVNGDNRMASPHHDNWFQLKGDLEHGKITRRQANIMYKEILSIHSSVVLEKLPADLVKALAMTKAGKDTLTRMAKDKPLVGVIGRNILYSGLKLGSWVNW